MLLSRRSRSVAIGVRTLVMSEAAVVLVILSLTAGCRKEEQRSHFPVSGYVTFDGKAVSGGTVTFHRTDTTGGGEINSLGHFSVNGDGLKPGEYFVSITPPPPFDTPPTFALDGPPRVAQEVPEFPHKYRSPLTSQFRVSVGEFKNVFRFAMVRPTGDDDSANSQSTENKETVPEQNSGSEEAVGSNQGTSSGKSKPKPAAGLKPDNNESDPVETSQ